MSAHKIYQLQIEVKSCCIWFHHKKNCVWVCSCVHIFSKLICQLDMCVLKNTICVGWLFVFASSDFVCVCLCVSILVCIGKELKMNQAKRNNDNNDKWWRRRRRQWWQHQIDTYLNITCQCRIPATQFTSSCILYCTVLCNIRVRTALIRNPSFVSSVCIDSLF